MRCGAIIRRGRFPDVSARVGPYSLSLERKRRLGVERGGWRAERGRARRGVAPGGGGGRGSRGGAGLRDVPPERLYVQDSSWGVSDPVVAHVGQGELAGEAVLVRVFVGVELRGRAALHLPW